MQEDGYLYVVGGDVELIQVVARVTGAVCSVLTEKRFYADPPAVVVADGCQRTYAAGEAEMLEALELIAFYLAHCHARSHEGVYSLCV